MSYLQKNSIYWQKGYRAPNVESWVFRPYGRILRPQFGLVGPGQQMLDWGCGQGAALQFFRDQGFDTYGVDISATDLERAKEMGHKVKLIDPVPRRESYFPGVQFDLIVSVQSFYYLNDGDMEECLRAVHDQLKPGGILYATMMGTQCWYHKHSAPAGNGMRVINIDTPRLKLKDYHVNFTQSREHLLQRFHLFEPRHTGYYDACWLESEGSEYHYTFIGQKAAT